MLVVHSVDHFEQLVNIRFPVTVRGEFAHESTKTDVVANNMDELRSLVIKGLEASPTSRVAIFPMPETLGELLENLSNDTAMHSSSSVRQNHPNFTRIVAFGDLATRYLLTKMAAGEVHIEYFMLLRELTGANPVPDAHRGQLDDMRLDWLAWAHAHDKLDPLAVDFMAMHR